MRRSFLCGWFLCGSFLSVAVGCSDDDDKSSRLPPPILGGSGGSVAGQGGVSTRGGAAGLGGSGAGGRAASGGGVGAVGGRASGGTNASGGAAGGVTGGAGAMASGGRAAAGAAGAPPAEGGSGGELGSSGAGGADEPMPGSGGEGGAAPAEPTVGVFVAVGYHGRRLRSIDEGATWIDDVIGEEDNDNWLLRGIGSGGGRFVAVGYRVMTSNDGKTWDIGEPAGQWFGDAAYGKGTFVAVGGYGRRGYSSDGESWTETTSSDEVRNPFRAVAYDDVAERWVAVGDDAGRVTTADGAAWEVGEGPEPSAGLNAIAAGGGIVVALGSNEFQRSTDGGLSWEAARPLAARDVAYADSHFVAVGTGSAYLSEDGEEWDEVPVNDIEGAIACHGDTCVAVSAMRAFRTTNGGTSWQPTQTFTTDTYAITAATWGPLAP